MTRISCASVVLLSCALIAGCGGGTQTPPATLPPPTALTLGEWKALPVEVKYDGATFERLKLTDPRLHNGRNWQAFENQHIIPERKKDIPGHPGNPPQATK